MKFHPVDKGVARPIGVVVVTSVYRAIHGTEPAGRRRWVFQLGRATMGLVFAARGDYAVVKQAAVSEARALGIRRVEVLS
jgi:hypothetical protein